MTNIPDNNLELPDSLPALKEEILLWLNKMEDLTIDENKFEQTCRWLAVHPATLKRIAHSYREARELRRKIIEALPEELKGTDPREFTMFDFPKIGTEISNMLNAQSNAEDALTRLLKSEKIIKNKNYQLIYDDEIIQEEGDSEEVGAKKDANYSIRDETEPDVRNILVWVKYWEENLKPEGTMPDPWFMSQEDKLGDFSNELLDSADGDRNEAMNKLFEMMAKSLEAPRLTHLAKKYIQLIDKK